MDKQYKSFIRRCKERESFVNASKEGQNENNKDNIALLEGLDGFGNELFRRWMTEVIIMSTLA